MIIEYHRPKTMPEALTLLAREQPVSYPLGGGTYLNRDLDMQYAVIDLQGLALDKIVKKGNLLQIGATATLQALLDTQGLHEAVCGAIRLEATYNLRQMATVAGTLVTARGRSSFVTNMLAMDATLEMLASDEAPIKVKLGDWLPSRPESKPNRLITRIDIPLKLKICYERIARSPADQPIVCAAVAQWPSGRTRLALGGWGKAPILAMDGPEPEGLEMAARSAYLHAEDEWASADYRQEMAAILAMRCIKNLNP